MGWHGRTTGGVRWSVLIAGNPKPSAYTIWQYQWWKHSQRGIKLESALRETLRAQRLDQTIGWKCEARLALAKVFFAPSHHNSLLLAAWPDEVPDQANRTDGTETSCWRSVWIKSDWSCSAWLVYNLHQRSPGVLLLCIFIDLQTVNRSLSEVKVDKGVCWNEWISHKGILVDASFLNHRRWAQNTVKAGG